MTVTYCEGRLSGKVSASPAPTVPGPAEKKLGGPRPPSASPPAAPAWPATERYQLKIRDFFLSAHDALKNAFRFFTEAPKPLTPAEEQKKDWLKELHSLSESEEFSLGMKLLCWGSGFGTEKCGAFLEESLKRYLREMETITN